MLAPICREMSLYTQHIYLAGYASVIAYMETSMNKVPIHTNA